MFLLQILKIAGIALLCISGLAVLLILLLLILPWRYRLNGKIRGKEYEGELTVSWMLKAVYLKQFAKSGEEAGGILKVFGLRLFRRNEMRKTEITDHMEQVNAPDIPLRSDKSPALTEDPVQKELEKQKKDKKEEQPFESPDRLPGELSEKGEISRKSLPDRWKDIRVTRPEEPVRMMELKLEGLIRKILSYSNQQAKELFRNGKRVITKLLNDSQESAEKLKQLKELFFGEKNRKEMVLLLRIIRKVLKQILPRKGSGMLVFGVGDPYYTGKILEILAFFYPLYGEVVQVCPWFEEEKLEADADIRGHFHPVVLLVCFARVWFNKKLRNIYSEFMRIISYEQSE